MTSKTLILITGANQGLGYYTAQQLAASGTYHVLLGSRDFNKAETAIESLANDSSVKVDAKDLEPLQIDINDDASISAAAETVEKKYGKLDILLNNAAVALPGEEDVLKSGGSSLRDFFRQHYETNVFGTVAVTEAFIPLLMKGEKKRLAFTSSSMGSLHAATEENLIPGVSFASTLQVLLADITTQQWVVYRSTKSALNMIMTQYAKTLEGQGFVVSASNPGYCATNLNAYSGLKDPREGAKALIRSVTGAKEDVHCLMVNETGSEAW
jgi:NAD(P)-dependent dehydrogenase (short-subunit alcohol dehydrogenase family)